MRVAIDSGFFLPAPFQASHEFIAGIVGYLASKMGAHEFIVLTNKSHLGEFSSLPKVVTVEVINNAISALRYKYWYDVKLPRILKKHAADVFIAPCCCSMKSNIPQCILLPDLGFLYNGTTIGKSFLGFYEQQIPKLLRKAAAVATISDSLKQDIIDKYKLPPQKISIVSSAPGDLFQSVSPQTSELIKEKYTGGTEFFLYTSPVHSPGHILNLLKAFSVFKKRQKSNFKLVLVFTLKIENDVANDSLKNYKYRDDVIVLNSVPPAELAKIVGSCYAFIYSCSSADFFIPLLGALKCNAPVLASSNASAYEVINDAALYFDGNSFEDTGEKMMLIYKDENLRSQLINKGKAIATQYSWKRTAEAIWQSIIETVD